MKNNNHDHQYLNAALLWKILRFSICFGVGLQVSFVGESQWSSSSSASVVLQPRTVTNQLIVPKSDRSLLLSQVIAPLTTNGRGSLEVSNGTSRDAYLKLVDPLTQQLVAAFFVKSDSVFTLEGIPDGNYEMLFVLGEAWDSSTRSFTRNKSFSKFDSPLEFITKQVGNGSYYSILKATLHEVFNGNAPTSEVTEEEFEKYQNSQ